MENFINSWKDDKNLKDILNTNKSYLNGELSVEGNNSSCYNAYDILDISKSEEAYV